MPYVKINYDVDRPPFEWVYLPEDIDAWLDACYASIGCKSIQVVNTVVRGYVLVIDEEGKCCDDWFARINPVATLLYGCLSDPIVGDAILAKIAGENLLPLTREDIEKVYVDLPIWLK